MLVLHFNELLTQDDINACILKSSFLFSDRHYFFSMLEASKARRAKGKVRQVRTTNSSWEFCISKKRISLKLLAVTKVLWYKFSHLYQGLYVHIKN